MQQFTTSDVSPLFSANSFKLYYQDNTVNNLFVLELNSDEEEDNTVSSTSVSKGEKFPVAVKVVPASSDYDDFTINTSSYVTVQNSTGIISQHTASEEDSPVFIDSTNKTIGFSWDTSLSIYPADSYNIVFWISITYSGATFLLKSDSVTKSVRQSTV